MTTVVLSQDYTDQEIGLNVARITISLKERGITDEDISREIITMREIYKRQYLEIKEIQDALLEKIKAEQSIKTKSSRLASSSGLVGDTIPETEKAALQSLYNSTDGEHWTYKFGWDFTQPVTNSWYGITIENGNVTKIELPSNSLNGFLPDLSSLTQLNTLVLSSNNNLFNGNNKNIPTFINNLTTLKILELENCNLEGQITNLSNLSSLEILDLGFNNFNPQNIPSWMFNSLTNLKILSLRQCNLKGSMLSSISQLANLESLNLSNNELIGSIPNEITTLTKLKLLNLSSNLLEGEIPTNIGNLIELQGLYFVVNNLSGSIPHSITALNKLIGLALFYNNLEGSIPNLTGLPLYRFSIEGNKFRFVDFVSEFNSYKNIDQLSYFNYTPFFGYSPQSKIDTIDTPTGVLGSSITFTMCEDGRFLPYDTFQWYKNNSLIPGATNRIYQLNNLASVDAGVYTCKSYHITNPDMSPLVLERNAITLTIENCAPVSGTIKILTTTN